MSLIYNHDMNFNGTSEIEDKVVVSFNASYRDENKVYIGKNYEDIETYNKNKEAVDADCAEFEKKVLEAIAASKQE